MIDRISLDYGQPAEEFFRSPLLFDTSVWILVQGPQIDLTKHRSKVYSKAYEAALRCGATILLPQIVATEFVNKCVHLAANLSGWDKTQGKVHACADYSKWVKDALDDLNAIIGDCTRVDDDFSSIDIEDTLNRAESAECDFNDVLISEICRRIGATLVTDDIDFRRQDISIASANRKLCP